MAFKPLEEKQRPETADKTKAPHQELDLNLEKENTELEHHENKEQRMAPEQAGPQKMKPALKRRPPLPAPVKDEVIIKIEKIMEEGLNDSYQRLSPVAQQEFKLKGEQTASQIRELLKGTHVKIKKILRLIFDWLRMLPGVNHFFLEQEAKIKTDRIISLKKKE
jgi:hypothetical protein